MTEKEEPKKPKRSLKEYLQIMKEFDDDILDLTIEEFSEMVKDDLPEKVDGCKEHIDYLDMRAAFMKGKKEELNDCRSL